MATTNISGAGISPAFTIDDPSAPDPSFDISPANWTFGELQAAVHTTKKSKSKVGFYASLYKEDPMVKTIAANGAVLSYSAYSKGAKAIAKGLDITFMYRENASQILTQGGINPVNNLAKCIINWGCASAGKKQPPGRAIAAEYATFSKNVINPFSIVGKCANKRLFFELMKSADGPRTPEFTTDIEVAKQWAADGHTVLGRVEHGSAGKDVAFYGESPEKFLGSDLWLIYKKKKQEFRLHFFGEDWIIEQQKVLPKLDPDGNPIPKDSVDFRIRTHRAGFIFQKNNITIPDDVYTQAAKARAILLKQGLTFGAIDVIYNKAEDKAYVLECNTAPGVEETSIVAYVDKFKELVKTL